MKLKKLLPVMLIMVACLFTLTGCEAVTQTATYLLAGVIGVIGIALRLVFTIVGAVIALIAGLFVGFFG